MRRRRWRRPRRRSKASAASRISSASSGSARFARSRTSSGVTSSAGSSRRPWTHTSRTRSRGRTRRRTRPAWTWRRRATTGRRCGPPPNEPLDGDLVLPLDKQGLPDRDRALPVDAGNLEKVRRQVHDGKAFVSGPLFGSESPTAAGSMGEIERMVVAAEGLRPEDFVIPRIPRLSSRGARRELVAPVRDLRWVVEGTTARLDFELQKGCYATSLLREFMKG